MLRACWCSASGNTETTMVSDVGTGWCSLHGMPSTMSNGDQSFQQWLFSTTLLNVYIFGRTDMALSISIMFTQQMIKFTSLNWQMSDCSQTRPDSHKDHSRPGQAVLHIWLHKNHSLVGPGLKL